MYTNITTYFGTGDRSDSLLGDGEREYDGERERGRGEYDLLSL